MRIFARIDGEGGKKLRCDGGNVEKLRFLFSTTRLYRKYTAARGNAGTNLTARARVLMSNTSEGSHPRAKRIYRSPCVGDVSFRKSEAALLPRHRDDGIYARIRGAMSQISRSIFPRGRIFRNKTVSVSKLSESRAIGILGTCSEIKFSASKSRFYV